VPLRPEFSLTDAKSRIASWLHDYESSHPNCGRDAPPAMPTRVIATSQDGDELYSYETCPGETGRYALSHCWGTPEDRPPMTFRGNLSQRKQFIPVTELPEIFKDAVQLCKTLGISYLWIDSLCIIQDDAVDWAQEAARMANVYESATITPSAKGAKNCKMGPV